MDNTQHTCDPCSLDAAVQNATSFCVVCVERLCGDCVKFHGKNKATRKHKILAGDEVPIDTDTFRLLAESAFCKTHPEREIQFKCEDHDEFICGICARKSHRHCEHMDEIDSELDENKAREECQLTINRSRDLCDKLFMTKNGTEEIIAKGLQGKEQAIEERRIRFRSIHDLITKLETKTYTDIDTLYDNQIQRLRSDIENTTAIEQQQIKDQALLDAALKYADTKTMEIITNTTARRLQITKGTISENESKPMQASRPNNFLETLIKHLEEEVKNNQPENQTPNEELSAKEGELNEAVIHGSDEYASCMLENDDIRCISQSDRQLEEIKVTPLQNCTDKKDTTTKERKELHKAIEKVTPSLTQPNLKHTKSLMERNVWLANDQQYDVSGYPSGCVLLEDKRLVTIGTTVRGHVMPVYNTNMIVIFESILDHDPYQICNLGERVVAITYSNYKRIDKFLILEDKIERHGGFPTKLYGRGITKHGNDIAVLFAEEEGDKDVTSKNDTVEIQIRRNDGRINDTIDVFEDMYGKELFIKDPDSILSLPNGDILVGDKTHLRCFDMDGECRWNLRSKTVTIDKFHNMNLRELELNLKSIPNGDILTLRCKWYLRSYKDHALKQVRGITTDGEGNILVCGNGSNNVHQLCGSNNRKNRVLIPQINHPICIAYDDEGESIIVGCKDRTIKVFKFV